MDNHIVTGCDNAAVELKKTVIALLKQKGFVVEDIGVDTSEDKTIYPEIAERVCQNIIDSNYTKKGVLICGTGIGMAITANKFPGIYAAVCHDSYSAERSILSNNCNVICMGARVIGPELAKKIVSEWIALEFVDGSSTPKVQSMRHMDAIHRL